MKVEDWVERELSMKNLPGRWALSHAHNTLTAHLGLRNKLKGRCPTMIDSSVGNEESRKSDVTGNTVLEGVSVLLEAHPLTQEECLEIDSGQGTANNNSAPIMPHVNIHHDSLAREVSPKSLPHFMTTFRLQRKRPSSQRQANVLIMRLHPIKPAKPICILSRRSRAT